MLDQDDSFYLISLKVSSPVCWITNGYYREKLYDENLRVKGLTKSIRGKDF